MTAWPITPWGRAGSLSRATDQQRREDIRRQRKLEANVEEHERVPRGSLADREDDEHDELPDHEPPGYARSGR